MARRLAALVLACLLSAGLLAACRGSGAPATGITDLPAAANPDTPGILDTTPSGAQVYVEHRLAGVTPLPLDRVPMYSMVTIVAPGHRVLQDQRLPERDMELVRLTPLDRPSPAEVAAERQRLLGALRWKYDGERWQAGPLPGYTEHWAPSPDGRWVAVTLQGPDTPAGWGLDLLLCLDLKGVIRPRPLAVQMRHPILRATGEFAGSIAMRVVGWWEGQVVTLRTAEPGPGAGLALIAEAFEPTGETKATPLGSLPLTILPHRWMVNAAWLGRNAVYLAAGPLQRIDLLTGEGKVLRDDLPVNESWGGVMATHSPDGERLLIRNGPMIDLATGSEIPVLPPGSEHDLGDWTPDGDLLTLTLSTPTHPGHWLHHADDSFMLPAAVRVLDREGREAALLTLPTGEHMLSRLWLPNGAALLAQASAPPETDDAEVWQPEDAGLYLLGLNGAARRVRGSAERPRWLVAAGDGWVAEYDWQQEALTITAWGDGLTPPLPPGPVTENLAVLPDGSLAAVGSGGQVWVCAPGAAAYAQRPGFGSRPDRPVQLAGPWLIGAVSDGDGTTLAGIRWALLLPEVQRQRPFALDLTTRT